MQQHRPAGITAILCPDNTIYKTEVCDQALGITDGATLGIYKEKKKNSRKTDTDNQYPDTDDQYPETDNQYPETDNQYPDTNNQYPDTNNQYPDTNDQYPDADDQYPDTNNQYPDTNNQYPDTDNQYPDADDQYPDTNNQYPDTNNQFSNIEEHAESEKGVAPNKSEEKRETLKGKESGGVKVVKAERSDYGVDESYARNFKSDERFYRVRRTKEEIMKMISQTEEVVEEDDNYLAHNELMPYTKKFASDKKDVKEKEKISKKKRKFNEEAEQVHSFIKEKFANDEKSKTQIDKAFKKDDSKKRKK